VYSIGDIYKKTEKALLKAKAKSYKRQEQGKRKRKGRQGV
jgi:ribosomal protein S6E (S10)